MKLASAAGSGSVDPASLGDLHGGETLGGGRVNPDQGVEVLLGCTQLEGDTETLGHLTSVGAQVVKPNNLEQNKNSFHLKGR